MALTLGASMMELQTPPAFHRRLDHLPRGFLQSGQIERGHRWRAAPLGIQLADVAPRRLQVGMAQVLLHRHEFGASLVQPSSVGAATIVRADTHPSTTD